MARCGRCGLWEKTPEDEREQKWAGTCLWYHTKLEKEFEYDERSCKDYVERIPPYTASWHFDHKVKREDLGDAYKKAQESDKKARIAMTISIVGLTVSFIKLFL